MSHRVRPSASAFARLVLVLAGLGTGAAPLLAAPTRGDSNGDGTIDLSDAIHTLSFLFTGGPAPACLDAADSNDDGTVDISDPVRTLSFLFTGGPAPSPVPPSCVPAVVPGTGFPEELAGGAADSLGKHLAVLSPADSLVYLTDVKGELVFKVKMPGTPTALEFTPDSQFLVVGTIPGGGGGGIVSAQVHFMEVATGKIAASIATGAPGLDLLTVDAPDACVCVLSRGAFQGEGGVLSLIDIPTRKLQRAIPVGDRPYDLEFVQGGKTILVSNEGGTVDRIDRARLLVAGSYKGLATPTDLLGLPFAETSVAVGNGDLGPAFHTLDLETGKIAPSRIRGPSSALYFDAKASRIWSIDPEHTSLQFETLAAGKPTGKGGVIILDRGEAPDIDPHFGGPGLEPITVEGRPALLFAAANDRVGVLDLEKGTVLGLASLAGEVTRIRSTADGKLGMVTAGNTLYVHPATAYLIDRLDLKFRPDRITFDFYIGLTGDRCLSNAAVLIDDGLNSAATSLVTDTGTNQGGARIYNGILQNAVARFYGFMPDIFDYCVVFYSSDWWGMTAGGNPIDVQPDSPGAAAYHTWTKNFTRGIGSVWTSAGGRWDNRAGTLTPPLTTKRLQSRLHMNDLGEWGAGQSFLTHQITGAARSGTAIYAQELGHRFICFVDTGAAMVVRRDSAHYSHVFNSGGSAVGGIGGNLITSLGGGQFRIDAQESTFPPLDQYLMGLIPQASVPDMFRVTNPVFPAGRPPFAVGDTFSGTQTAVTMASIVANEGTRRPADSLSQKLFTIGVALCVPANQVRNADLVELQAIQQAIRDFYATQTGGRAHLVVKTCPLMFSSEATAIPMVAPAGASSPGSVAIHPDGTRAFVSNLLSRRVAIVDTAPGSGAFNTVIDGFDASAAGSNLRPVDLELNAAGTRLYVVLQNQAGVPNGQVKVFNAATKALVGTVDVGDDPRAIAVSRGGPLNRAYVVNRASNTISVINTDTNALATTWNTSINSPRDVVVSADGLVVLWTNTGDSTVASRHVTSGVIIPVTLPESPFKIALVQNESVVNNTSARALASDTPPALVYVTTAGTHVYPLDLKTITGLGIHVFDRLHTNPDGAATPVVPPIEVEGAAQGVTFLGNGAVALVTHRQVPGKVSIISTANHQVLEAVTLSGDAPVDVKVTPDGDRAYVACENSDSVVVLK